MRLPLCPPKRSEGQEDHYSRAIYVMTLKVLVPPTVQSLRLCRVGSTDQVERDGTV